MVLFLDMPSKEISRLEGKNNGELLGVDFQVCFYIF